MMFEMPELRKEERRLEKNKPFEPPKTNKLLSLDAIEEMQAKNSKETQKQIFESIQARARRTFQVV